MGEAASETRSLAAQLGVSAPEAVRRGLTLLKLYASLTPGEELVIWNKDSGHADRLRIHWDRTEADEARAKKLCGGCSERARCLAFALEHGEAFGVWGGLNANERLALTLAERSATAKQVPPASPAGRAEDGPSSG